MTLDNSEKSSFGAVIDDQTHVVVFGSLPGEESLRRGEYYAKKSNQFWRLMDAVLGTYLATMERFEDRKRTLLSARVGLWDVVQSARREGSLDSNIRGHQANDLVAFRSRHPAVRRFAFNGGKAFELARKQFERGDEFLIPLPSSSAAYCAMSLDVKKAEWREKLVKHLG